MKKMFTILMVLCVLLGMSGCSTRRTYKTEDYEIYDIISELDELKKDVEETDGVTLDYDLTRGYNGKYTAKIVIEFGDHKAEMKTHPFTIQEFNEEFQDMEIDDVFTFKLDGTKYDYATFDVLMEHYAELYYYE